MKSHILIFFIGLCLSAAGCFRAQKPVLTISSFEVVDKGDGFKILRIYGVNQDPAVVMPIAENARNRWLVFTADEYFVDQIGLHFETMTDPSLYMGSTLFASRSGSGSKFRFSQVNSEGKEGQATEVRANMAVLEVGEKGREIRLKPQTP